MLAHVRASGSHCPAPPSRPYSYRYDWELGEAQKNLLRTHTTAVSARMLYQVAQQVGGAVDIIFGWNCAARPPSPRPLATLMVPALVLSAFSQKPFKPVKYFSIDRVFRNETLDATHLAEFHQIEGVIADYNLTLGDLMGTLSTFFERLGGSCEDNSSRPVVRRCAALVTPFFFGFSLPLSPPLPLSLSLSLSFPSPRH